jgi:HK97 family phage prohead protease
MIIQTKAAPALTKSVTPFEVKAVDEAKRTFQGLASTWDEDLGGDRIVKGAFRKTLGDWKAAKGRKPIFLLDQHNYYSIRSILGRLASAQETDAGLETEWEVIEGADGDEAMRRVKGGFITGLSIGYSAVKWETEKVEGGEEWETIRILKEVKLYEVSLVIWPMNEGAVIDPASLKSLTAALREGRLSESEKAEIRALLSESAPPAGAPASTPAGDGAAHYEKQAALNLRIRLLNLHRAADGTRAGG